MSELLYNSSIHEGFLPKMDASKFLYPTFIPPQKIHRTNDYVTSFLGLYNELLEQYNLKDQKDEIFFLGHAYNKIKLRKNNDRINDEGFKTRGKLLYELIKAPIRQYTVENIHEAFSEERLDGEDPLSVVKLYLSTLTGKHVKEFETSKSKIDYSKIDKELCVRLIERILADTNISIEMENGRYLIVSASVEIQISYKNPKRVTRKKTLFNAKDQSPDLIYLIINQLLNEQKTANTELYEALLQFDFIKRDLKPLTKVIGKWHVKDQRTYCFLAFRDLFERYFNDHNLLSTQTAKGYIKRDSFIMQYLILLGLYVVDGSTSGEGIENVRKNLEIFKLRKRNNPNYSVDKFIEFRKNLNR